MSKIKSKTLVLAIVCSIVLYLVDGLAHASSGWLFLQEAYGDLYEWTYDKRTPISDKETVVIIRITLPEKEVVPANGFRKYNLRVIGIRVSDFKFSLYEELWLDRDNRIVSHQYWDTNFRPIRDDEVYKVYCALRDRR